MSDYGLQEPQDIITELQQVRMKYDPTFQAQLLETLNQNVPNNVEQKELFDFVKQELDSVLENTESSKFIFINGPAGIKQCHFLHAIFIYLYL